MRNRYIIAISSLTTEEEKIINDLIDSYDGSWWHWIENIWLFATENDNFSTKNIREDIIEKLGDSVKILVIGIDPTGDGWAGLGPSDKQKNMFNWLQENWK